MNQTALVRVSERAGDFTCEAQRSRAATKDATRSMDYQAIIDYAEGVR